MSTRDNILYKCANVGSFLCAQTRVIFSSYMHTRDNYAPLTPHYDHLIRGR